MIASDGLWKYTTPEKVGSIMMSYAKDHLAEDAANEIVEVATQRWAKHGLKTEDITVIVVFFDAGQI